MGGTYSTLTKQSPQANHVSNEDENNEVVAREREVTVLSSDDVKLSSPVQPDITISSSRLNTEQTGLFDKENSDDEFEDALDDLDTLTSSSSKVSLSEFQQLQASILGKLVSEVEELLLNLSNQTDRISSEQCQVLLSSVNAVTQAYSAAASPKNSPSKLTNGRRESPQPNEKSIHSLISTNHKQSSEDSESGVNTTSLRGDRNDSLISKTESVVMDLDDTKADGKQGRSSSSSSSNTAWEIDLTNWGNTEKKKIIATKRILRKHDTDSENKSTPQQVQSGFDDMSQRKVLDIKRWYCMSRPQIKRSCGISSLVSCWNYLFTSLGHGNLPPLTQEQALTLLGFQPPFDEILYGKFTGNKTLMRWFKRINDHFGVNGRTYFLYKPQGRNKTCGITSDLALDSLKRGLHDNHTTFIYHCQNHYFCPIGFEDTSLNPEHAYSCIPASSDVETWVLIGDPSKKHPGIHFKRWADISTDLNCRSPEYCDIRQIDKGIQKRKTKKVGGNLHCIITFQKCRKIDTQASKSLSRSKSPSAVVSAQSGMSENGAPQENDNANHRNQESVTYFGDHTDSDVIDSEIDAQDSEIESD